MLHSVLEMTSEFSTTAYLISLKYKENCLFFLFFWSVLQERTDHFKAPVTRIRFHLPKRNDIVAVSPPVHTEAMKTITKTPSSI